MHRHLVSSLPGCPVNTTSATYRFPLAPPRRYTQRPWLAQLQEQVPELGGITQWENGRVLPQWPESAVNMNAKAVSWRGLSLPAD